MEERVVLVDEIDRELGTEEKLHAHRSGALHRAVSVFLFDGDGRMLLQRRAQSKYHSAGLWSNACCSHPRPGESSLAAAHRRLREELGIDCTLDPAFAFTYRVQLANGLIEHELDHVFIGRPTDAPVPNPDEADSVEWVEPDLLARDIAANPMCYTAWLPLALSELRSRGLADRSRRTMQPRMKGR